MATPLTDGQKAHVHKHARHAAAQALANGATATQAAAAGGQAAKRMVMSFYAVNFYGHGHKRTLVHDPTIIFHPAAQALNQRDPTIISG